MSEFHDTYGLIRVAASKHVLFLPHAVRQMSRPDRMISAADVVQAIENGQVIEDYPDDPRGHSALVLGPAFGADPLHVVCAPKSNYLAIITAYWPDDRMWEEGNSRRTRRWK